MAKELNLKDVITKRITKDFGKTFSALKTQILKTVDKSGVSDYFNSKQGYEIFYTSNVYYGGGGKGFYAIVNLPTKIKKYVKLSS